MKSAFLIFVLIISYNFCLSKTCKWTGDANGDWSLSVNWENYDVPKENDDVIIPSGTKNICQISSKYISSFSTMNVEVNNITVYGTLEIQDGKLNANNITNEGNVISSTYNSEIYGGFNGCTINCNNFQNNSNFLSDGGHAEINANNFTNSGQLNCNTVFANSFNCKNFKNELSGEVKIKDHTRITSSEIFENHGQVIIDADSYSKVTINAGGIANNKSGLIYNIGKGNICFNANGFSNSGTIAAKGKSDININGNAISHEEGKIKSGEKKSILKDLDIPLNLQDCGNVNISAKTNLAFVLSAGIIADTINIIFNDFDIVSLNEDSLILANKIILNGLSNSVFDIKRSGSKKFLCSYGDIIVNSDSISPSIEKLREVCNGNLVINKSDLNYVSASIFPYVIVDKSGVIDSAAIPVFFKTTSTKSWSWSISSKKGWVEETSGNFNNASPLTFDSIYVHYNLPNDADTLPDIVTIQLTESNSGYETRADFEIYSRPNVTTDVNEPYTQSKVEINPNPFSESTNINYELQTAERVKIDIFNSLGEKITTLVDEFQGVGRHNCELRITNYELTSGMYFYRIQIGERIESGKLLLIR